MPDYPKILAHRNSTNAFSRLLHIETVEMTAGYARAVMPIQDNLLNPQGAVHGGVVYTIADIAGGNAAASHGEWIATMCADFHYLRPGLNVTTLTAVAHEVKYGKRASVCNVEVADQDGTVLACGIFTFSRLGKPILEDEG